MPQSKGMVPDAVNIIGAIHQVVEIDDPLSRHGGQRNGNVKEADLAMMRLIDELHLKRPFFGARKIAFVLSESGYKVGRHRVSRLMRLQGLYPILFQGKNVQGNFKGS
jgi:hypothetical protein